MFAILHRAFTDSLLVFDTVWKTIGLTVLGAIVTAGLVYFCRGWRQFKEHVIANILIVFGGAVATWLLVFVWVWIHVPSKMQVEQKANLDKVIEEKRQLSMAVNTKQVEIDRLKRQASVALRVSPVLNPRREEAVSSVSVSRTLEEAHTPDGKLLESLQFSVDKNLDIPAFLVVCNRVCIGRVAGCTGLSQATVVNSSPYAVEAFFRLPRPLPAGNDCQIDLLSADGAPFKVTSFRILKESEVPLEQR